LYFNLYISQNTDLNLSISQTTPFIQEPRVSLDFKHHTLKERTCFQSILPNVFNIRRVNFYLYFNLYISQNTDLNLSISQTTPFIQEPRVSLDFKHHTLKERTCFQSILPN